GFQALGHVTGDALAREFEVGERGRHLLAADELRDEIELLRAHPQHAGDRLRLILRKRAFASLLAHVRSLASQVPPPPAAGAAAGAAAAGAAVAGPPARLALRSDEWPQNIRVRRNSPDLWPTISSVTSTGMCFWPL